MQFNTLSYTQYSYYIAIRRH